MNDDGGWDRLFFRHLNDVPLPNVIAAARNEIATRINENPLDDDDDDENCFLETSLAKIDTWSTRVAARSFDSRPRIEGRRLGRAIIGNRFSSSIPASRRFIPPLSFRILDFTNRIVYGDRRTGWLPTMLDGISVFIDPEDRSATGSPVDGPPEGSSRTLEHASNSLIDSHVRCSSGIPTARACQTSFIDSASKTLKAVAADLSIGPVVSDSPNPLGVNIGRKWPIDGPLSFLLSFFFFFFVLSARPGWRRPAASRVLDGAPGSVVGRWRTMVHER